MARQYDPEKELLDVQEKARTSEACRRVRRYLGLPQIPEVVVEKNRLPTDMRGFVSYFPDPEEQEVVREMNDLLTSDSR